MATITRDEWLKALGEAVKPCDPDALTVRELCQRYGTGSSVMRERVNQLVQQKKAVRVWKIVEARRVPAYKLIK